MHVKLLFPSKYIKSEELEKDVTITIVSVVQEELVRQGGEREIKPCVQMKGTHKLWVLNKTNAAAIASLLGNEVDAWSGKRITIYGIPAEERKPFQSAINVRPKLPPTKEKR